VHVGVECLGGELDVVDLIESEVDEVAIGSHLYFLLVRFHLPLHPQLEIPAKLAELFFPQEHFGVSQDDEVGSPRVFVLAVIALEAAGRAYRQQRAE
jgi:hypothetical protein